MLKRWLLGVGQRCRLGVEVLRVWVLCRCRLFFLTGCMVVQVSVGLLWRGLWRFSRGWIRFLVLGLLLGGILRSRRGVGCIWLGLLVLGLRLGLGNCLWAGRVGCLPIDRSGRCRRCIGRVCLCFRCGGVGDVWLPLLLRCCRRWREPVYAFSMRGFLLCSVEVFRRLRFVVQALLVLLVCAVFCRGGCGLLLGLSLFSLLVPFTLAEFFASRSEAQIQRF